MMNESHQELLSAYLDDALTGDEKAHVERLLHEDASFAKQFASLKSLQADVRSSLRTDATLGSDFSNRVWEAVIARADAEALPATHPVRLAQANDRGGNASLPAKTWLGGLVALAACLLLAFAMNFGGEKGDPAGNGPPQGLIASVVEPPEANASSIALGESKASLDDPTSSASALASNSISTDQADRVALGSGESKESAAIAGDDRVAMNDAKATSPERPSVDGLAKGDGNDSNDALVASSQNALSAFAVLLEVELTQRGRDLNELDYALETAGITQVKPSKMSEQHLESLVECKMIDALPDDSEATLDDSLEADTQLLFLQGPGKRLDRFMLSLLTRPSVVKRVGFQLVIDPRLTATLDAIKRQQRKTVQHTDTAALGQHLVYGSQSGAFLRASKSSSFVTLDEQTARNMQWTAEPPGHEGPDFQSHLLVLVRCPR